MLEVDDATGKAYQKFSPENKQQFNQLVSIMLKKAINAESAVDYKNFLDEIGAEAEKNGLTPEILNDLLHADD